MHRFSRFVSFPKTNRLSLGILDMEYMGEHYCMGLICRVVLLLPGVAVPSDSGHSVFMTT